MQINISHNNKNLQRPRHPGSRFLLRSLSLHHVGPITLIIFLVREHTPPTDIAGQPIMGGQPLRLVRPLKRLFYHFFLYILNHTPFCYFVLIISSLPAAGSPPLITISSHTYNGAGKPGIHLLISRHLDRSELIFYTKVERKGSSPFRG